MSTNLLEALDHKVEKSWPHINTCLPVLEYLPQHILTLELSHQFDNELVVAVMHVFVAYS